jgi:hypothetical protein
MSGSKGPQDYLARIMHSRVRGECCDESKRLGHRHLRSGLMLKGGMQPARPGRPGALAVWTAPIVQAQGLSR